MDNILAFLIRVDPAIEVAIAESTLDWDKFVKGPFEALVGAVFGKRVRYTSARVNRALVYDRLGGTVFGPEDVAGLVTDPSACAAVGLTGGHVRTLSMLCVHARTHPLASADDVRRVAKAVDGVGPWTVESAVVASLLDSDAFPREDRWVARKMRDLYGLSRIPGAAEAEALSRRWSPYRAVAVAYLWRWFDEAETRRIAKADAVAAPKTIKQSRNKTPSGNKAALASSRTR
jgi:3-methyladenine DNA glycosylase/8-oxoguanine DNA glycosylase